MARPQPSLRTLRTRREAVRVFVRQPSPRIIVAGLLGAVTLRARDRELDPRDAVVLGAVAATQGLHEWVIHRFVLHAEPRRICAVTLDPGVGHRAHHDHPDTIDDALLKPHDAALFLAMIAAYVGLTCAPWRGRMARRNVITGVAAAYAALLTYEWNHYLDHTSVPLRSSYAQQLRTHHRLHHNRDERAWLGITSASGDRLFRTRPTGRTRQRGSQMTTGMSRSVLAWYSS